MSGVPSGRCYNWLARPDTMRPRLDPRSLAAMLPAGVLLLVLIAAAGLFATDGARVIRFRYPMDYGEGPLLDQTMRLGRLESIYRVNPTSPPYTVSNPPVYPLALSPLGRVWDPAFWYGRLLSWLSTVAAGVLVGLILHAFTRDQAAALIGGFRCSPFRRLKRRASCS